MLLQPWYLLYRCMCIIHLVSSYSKSHTCIYEPTLCMLPPKQYVYACAWHEAALNDTSSVFATDNFIIIFTPSKLTWLCVWCIANAGEISLWQILHVNLYINIWEHLHKHCICCLLVMVLSCFCAIFTATDTAINQKIKNK